MKIAPFYIDGRKERTLLRNLCKRMFDFECLWCKPFAPKVICPSNDRFSLGLYG